MFNQALFGFLWLQIAVWTAYNIYRYGKRVDAERYAVNHGFVVHPAEFPAADWLFFSAVIHVKTILVYNTHYFGSPFCMRNLVLAAASVAAAAIFAYLSLAWANPNREVTVNYPLLVLNGFVLFSGILFVSYAEWAIFNLLVG